MENKTSPVDIQMAFINAKKEVDEKIQKAREQESINEANRVKRLKEQKLREQQELEEYAKLTSQERYERFVSKYMRKPKNEKSNEQ